MDEPATKPPLKEQLEQFYGEVEMRPDMVEDLLGPNETGVRGALRFWKALSIAALVALLGAGAFLTWKGLMNPGVTEMAFAEVAKNHRKDYDPEVFTNDYADLREGLRLDFDIAPPEDGLFAGYELVGGRHCKVQGEFAAQLKLRRKEDGSTATAYVVPIAGKLEKIGEAAYRGGDGLSVRCERVGTQLYFIAED